MINLEKVTKIFRRDSFDVLALDCVDLYIGVGQFLALMGPSGSGKTTLLNLIACIDRPSSGVIRVEGEDISALSDGRASQWRNLNIGYVFQTFNLLPVLTAFENVELPLLLTGLNKKTRRDHVLNALELVGLADRAGHLPKQLSGGQEQRVAIARAIATDPAILLADEPTGDLDRASASQILEIFQKLNEYHNKTVIMVTHDPEAASYAHQIRHLEKASLVPATSIV